MRNLLGFSAIHKEKKKTKPKTPLWSLKTPLSKAKWLRLCDSGRGLRIAAVKGCVTEVMHQEGSSLNSLLDTCSILSFVFTQGMHVAHSLSAGVPEGSWASVSSLHQSQVAFSLVAVTGSACSWNGSLHLRWLFEFGSKVGGAPSSLLWPFLSF